jgi:hypothetical protein
MCENDAGGGILIVITLAHRRSSHMPTRHSVGENMQGAWRTRADNAPGDSKRRGTAGPEGGCTERGPGGPGLKGARWGYSPLNLRWLRRPRTDGGKLGFELS